MMRWGKTPAVGQLPHRGWERPGLGAAIRSAARLVAAPMSDRLYCSLRYLSVHGRLPDIDRPLRFSEKLQWRKLYDRNPLFPLLTDKLACKGFVASRIGGDHVVPTLWSGTELREVDWTSIVFPAVIKPAHASGLVSLLKDRGDAEAFRAAGTAERWLRIDHSLVNREWAYGSVPPRLLIEPACLAAGRLPADYRFHMFGGQLSHIEVDFERDGRWSYAYRGPGWAPLAVHDPDARGHFSGDLPPPRSLGAMMEAATRLSEDIDYIRVDFLVADDRAFVGELTVYPAAGFERFDPPSFDLELGTLWRLPQSG